MYKRQPYVFEQIVVGGAVPKNYFPAVEKGIQDATVKGPLAGYPVVGVKAVLYDGSYHPVDSSEMAFKTAASQAFKKGFMEASPVPVSYTHLCSRQFLVLQIQMHTKLTRQYSFILML